MLTETLPLVDVRFRTADDVRDLIIAACESHPKLAQYHNLGDSEEGRTIDAVTLGKGPTLISLLAGAHADEPVGPEMLRHLVLEILAEPSTYTELLEKFTFCIIPHVNPDGEANNQTWIKRWPDPLAYLEHTVRELPGRDVEFGYPEMRIENERVSAYLRNNGPFAMHLSLHGMGVAEGAMLLIERHCIDRTPELRNRYRQALTAAGVGLHDHDRKGDKGFIYIEPGFTTTPEGTAMRDYFLGQNDAFMASQFHSSSMEFVRSLATDKYPDPLCMVTELPLFELTQLIEPHVGGVPSTYLKFKELVPQARLKLQKGAATESIASLFEPFGLKTLDITTAMRLQLKAIDLGLEVISNELARHHSR